MNSMVTHQLPVLYTTRHLPGRHRISAIMSGEAHATGPPEIDDDPRPFDVTPYSGVWWAGSPYRSFKDFMEHMNRNDAGLFRTSVCTAIVDEGENYPNYVCGQHDYRSEMTFGPWCNELGWRCSGCAKSGSYVTLKRAGLDVTAPSYMSQYRNGLGPLRGIESSRWTQSV